jgi:molybdopterin-guanine dinucleotide biosynthesis protein A
VKGAPHEARLANVGAALLLGGASSRMGRDKAHLPVGGVPAAARIAELLARLCEEVLLVGGDPPPGCAGRRVEDPPGPRCGLRGLTAALEASQSERLLVVATDLPLLTPDLLLALVAWPEADAVVPRTAEGAHPLCAIYRREAVAGPARAHLEAGTLALRELLGAVQTSYLEPADVTRVDPDGRALTNVNTPEDLLRAEEALRAVPARAGG